MGEDPFLAGTTLRAIAGITLRHIVLSSDGSHLLKFVGRRCIAVRRWWADLQHRLFPERANPDDVRASHRQGRI